MVRRWVLLAAVTLASFVLVALALGRLTATPERIPITQPGPLIVVGVPGQTWETLSASKNPALWPLLDVGASGSVSVRATTTPTCTTDAWLSLSAGNGAELGCDRPLMLADGQGAVWPGWSLWRSKNDNLRSSATIGLLASELAKHKQCVGAIGPGAALAAADRNGHVARYWPDAAGANLAACAVTFVDLSAPGGGAQPGADAALAQLFTDVPGNATVVVTGLSDGTADKPGLRSLIMVGPRVARGTIWSPSTHQEGFAQASDITATALSRFGITSDDVAGQELSVIPSTSSVSSLVSRNRGLVRAVDESNRALIRFFVAIGLIYAATLGAAVVMWRRTRRTPPWLRPATIFLGALPVATYLVNLVPWWSGGPKLLWFTLGVLAMAGAVTLLALLGPWRRWTAGPVVVVAATTAVVMALDVICGTPLQLLAIQGLQPLYGGRYYGMGNAGFGVFATAVLLVAGLLAMRLVWWDDTSEVDRRLAAATVGVIGVAAVVVDGFPSWGADFGGPPALIVATALLACLAIGLRLTWRRIVLIAAAVVVVAGGLAVLDWLRPASSRTHLGRFVQQVLDGDGFDVVGSKLSQNWELLTKSPFILLVPIVLVVAIWAVLRPDSRVGRPFVPLWAEFPLLRETVGAVLACWTVAFLLNDSGVGVPATGAQVAVPLLIALTAGTTLLDGGGAEEDDDNPA
ncbi:hypothetical protein [Luteipulveratus mongoliensis]|uniref:Uncharacterized protein n=1 Tax=Luteipulveratus mongoliensis TaxID=571913 RepID=A0A0K1JP22_9MICO|nr:hypothetical protein [Luteipulveratus mongoliensis]AKU18469.1 hypothetical protein VV02_25775 [Luteipulveratus mongoliensis]